MSHKVLTHRQFDILSALAIAAAPLSQRTLAERTCISPASVNRCLQSLHTMGYVASGTITEAGYRALEPYRVKRAVILAAGFGARLIPLSLNTPKPLIRIKGIPIIHTLLDALLAAGIEDITIIRGHLGEQFNQLTSRYPMIRFIDNPDYIDTENIKSALCAKELLQNAYILEGDLYLHKTSLIRPYEYSSNYLGVPVSATDDWCFQTRNRYISEITIGGRDCFHMYGISYWDEKDGKQLAIDLEEIYSRPGGKQRYWDQVPAEYCIKNYQIEIRPCDLSDISEVDSYSDLQKLDPSYREVIR